MGRLHQEIQFLQKQVRQDPEGGLNRASLATAYLQMARATGQPSWYLLADRAAQQSLAKLPFENSQALLALARVAEARHDFATALRLVTPIAQQPEATALQVTSNLAVGNLTAAERAVTPLAERSPSLSTLTLQAMVQVARGKTSAALESFQQALALEEPGEVGNSARTRTLMGRFFYEQGKLAEAEALYQEALRILPNYPPALLNLGQLAIRQKDYAAADRYYTQLKTALQGNPSIYDGLLLRGMARVRQLKQDSAGAETALQEAAVRLKQPGFAPGSFEHRRDLAKLLLERGQPQDISEAVALMQQEIQVRQDADTLETFAWALMQAKRWQEARSAIQQAIAQGEQNAALFYRAGEIEQALGNSIQALADFQRAKAIDPNFDEAARTAAELGIGLSS